MMKQALVVFALIGLAFSAPQARKLFHEHVEDFLDIIDKEAVQDLEDLMQHYSEFEEYWQAVDYMSSNNFKDLVYEMEALPEFKAVVKFLENDNIDIHYFIDFYNSILEGMDNQRSARHTVSGRDFTSFVKDCISVFPKEKLKALFDQKMSEDEEFRTAIENLQSEEWEQTFNALWESEVFQTEVKVLSENGIEMEVLLDEIMAVFGQN